MDWFKQLTGFEEKSYEDTRQKLAVEGRQLKSLVNGRSFGIGELQIVSLQTLKRGAQTNPALPGRLKVSVVTGDVRQLHQSPEYANALFQVASQFNMLEMTSYDVTPEMGVTRYQSDHTQGPACALAAGAATIYRNYFAPVGDEVGQTHTRQLDGLADLGKALGAAVGKPVNALWSMRNGYAMCTQTGLEAITEHLEALGAAQYDALAAKLRIGVHQDVDVTDADGVVKPVVSQAFCSALPVSYGDLPRHAWKSFACLVLQAAYEASLWAAVLNAQRGKSNIVLLTRLGGGAFGNEDNWIDAAIQRALQTVKRIDLDVRLVGNSAPSLATLQMVENFA